MLHGFRPLRHLAPTNGRDFLKLNNLYILSPVRLRRGFVVKFIDNTKNINYNCCNKKLNTVGGADAKAQKAINVAEMQAIQGARVFAREFTMK